MKIRSAGTEFFHEYKRTDKRTDRQEDTNNLIAAFRNFANAPKNKCFDVQFVHLSQQFAQKNEGCLG